MTIIYRTTDGARWGAGLGSNLSAAQVDGNFWELHEAIQNVTVQNGVGIASASVSGNQLSFTLTDNATLGPFTLPTISLNPRGAWQAGTVYAVNDLVTNNGSVHLVIRAHTSAALFDPGANDGNGHDYYAVLISVPGNALPVGGVTGQVLSKSSNTDFATGWSTPRYVPNGGLEGQVLSKSSDNAYDIGWSDVAAIPAGGLAGQFLKKTNGTDYNVEWATIGNLVSSTVAISSSSTSIDPSTADIFQINVSQSTTITFSQIVAKQIYLVFISAGSSETITFSSGNIIAQGTLSIGGTSKYYVASFIPISGKYLEVSRTTQM